MGNTGNKLNYRDSLHQLCNNVNTPKCFQDEFWKQFWPDAQLVDINELFTWISCTELRALRENKPQNFSKLVIYCSEKLISCSTSTFCNTIYQQNVALNCCRLLIRLLPYVYEDEDFSKLFWLNLNLNEEFLNEEKVFNEKSILKEKKSSNNDDLGNDLDSDLDENKVKNKTKLKKKTKKQGTLATRLIDAICDLLFCPEFTVIPSFNKTNQKGTNTKTEPDTPPIELSEIDSCEFIWQSGVGFTASQTNSSNLLNLAFTNTYNLQNIEKNRIDFLRLLLVMFSETMYKSPNQVATQINRCLYYFTSSKNRHCLPLFTSFLNTILAYQPNSSYLSNLYNTQNNINKEQLVELCLQTMIVCLDHDFASNQCENSQRKNKNYNLNKQTSLDSDENMSNDYCSNMVANNNVNINNNNTGFNADDTNISNQTDKSMYNLLNDQTNNLFNSNFVDLTLHENLFINYLARLHREEDFQFILDGFVSLLNLPLVSTYLSNNNNKVQFHQELLILFWKFCDLNKKFLYFTLKNSKILKILTPILYHLNESRGDQSKLGLIHIGVFIILLLSGERNFGVRLNKPFNNNLIIFKQIPIFSGTHADLLIIVFHKLITTGSTKLQSLFECLLTIIVNVSPYLKTITMVSANKLLHFFEAFSTPWFLYCNENNHHLVFYLLEIFNNIIQYQFDGNSNLIYTLIRKRNCFHQLVNLPTDYYFICKSLNKPEKKVVKSQSLLTREEIEYSMKKCKNSSENLNEKANFKNYSKNENKGTSELNLNKNKIQNLNLDVSKSKLINEEIKNQAEDNQENIEYNNLKEKNDNNDEDKKEFSNCDVQQDLKNKSNEDVKENILNEDKIKTNTLLESSSKKMELNKLEKLDKNSPNKLNSETVNTINYKVKNKDNMKKKKKNKEPLNQVWKPTSEWVSSWKKKLPLQTIMRMLQVLVPQVEKMCLDKGITDESEILKFLEHGTLVGLLPVPHPILIRKYQTNSGTTLWFRTYMWGIIYLRNINPSIWYDTEVKLFEIQKI